jgi:hypothetical protein
MAALRAIAIAWFRREDYQRIREISDDDMIPTFEEFEAKMVERMASFEAPGVILEKAIIDPEELLEFAGRLHGGKINAQIRSQLAAAIIAKKHGTDH